MSDVLRIYVAGSSDEPNRARMWIAKLREKGFEVISTWCDDINKEQGGVPNPRSASQIQRFEWAARNFDQVEGCDLFWQLVPSSGHGRGSYAELGLAVGRNKRIFCSGDTLQSVFTACGIEFATDAEAFTALCSEMGALAS